MSTSHLIADLEAQLVAIRRRLDKLKQEELLLVERLQSVRIHPNLALQRKSLGCKKMETAWRRFQILQYISSYQSGLSSKELQDRMHLHSIIYNASTIRVEISRLKDNGLLQNTPKSKKWTITNHGKCTLSAILDHDGGNVQ